MASCTPRSRRRSAALAVVVAGLSWAVAAPARAADATADVSVDSRLGTDGLLAVSETLTFPTGAPSQVVQRLATRQAVVGDGRLVRVIDQVRATAGSADLAPQVTTDGDDMVVTIDTSRAQKTPVTISYRVAGAVRQVHNGAQAAHTEVSWGMLQGLSVPVRRISGTMATPGNLSYVNCEAGPASAMIPCTTWGGGTHEAPEPTFSDGPRAAGDVVQLEVGIQPGVVTADAEVEHPWSLDRAFTVNRPTLLASLLPLLVGGALLYLLHRRRGRDLKAGRITPVAEFTPVAAGQSRFTVLGDVRPGHVGTVADEHVDPVDVTATLLDLAVRGWLRIVELPRDRARQSPDWLLQRVEGGQGELTTFERTLRDAVAPEGSDGTRVSSIDAAIAPVVETVQGQLYDDVVARGWFERRPDATRGRWQHLGIAALVVAVVATVVLVATTTFGLVGVALVVLALGAAMVGQEMPRRTASGTALLGGMAALASQLQTQPTTQLPPGEEYRELSRILPYAVVLGGRDRWIRALVEADDDDLPDGDDLDWYKAPDDWHLRDLPDSLDAFVVAVQGRLYGR